MRKCAQLLAAVLLVSCSRCAAAAGSCSADADVIKFSVGAVNATVLSDGVLQASDKFMLVDAIASIRAYEHLYLTPFEFDYHPVVFHTGSMTVLVDTGNGPGASPGTGLLLSQMRKAGIPPESIDAILLSHGHGDHFGGLVYENGSAVFPNAKVYLTETEFDFWSADPVPYPMPELILPEFGSAQANRENFLRALKPYKGRVFLREEGAEVLPGFTFVSTRGHTPGHVSVRVASGNATVLVTGDAFISLPGAIHNPEWRFRFDVEGATAVATRYSVFDKLARSGELVLAYHLQFPLGRIITDGAAFDWVPANV